MGSPSTVQNLVIGASLAALCGCAGYWSSNRSNVGTYAGAETFGESSKPLPVEIAVLGTTKPNDEAIKTLSQVSSNITQVPINSRTLIYADCGIAAAHAGDVQLAGQFLDEAVQAALSVTVAGEREIRATALTGSESEKMFKGEPHERAVAFLYRGLLFMAEDDIDNAQACFKAGALESGEAANSADRAKWLSLDLLLAECKSLAKHADLPEWTEYIKTRYNGDLLPLNWPLLPAKPLIVLAAVGGSPDKIAGKSKGEELQYRANESRVSSISFINGTNSFRYAKPVDDCYMQAVTRGQRNMDQVLAAKAGVRRGVEGAGAVVSGVAPLVPYAGPILMFARELSWSVSANIKSGADVRQMRMVPGKFYLAILDATEIHGPIRVEMTSDQGRTIGEGSIQPDGEAKGAQIALVRFPY
ncbi:MAG: hypothetical protein ABSD58_10765 [Verrucomicrobiia bacterium]|jgi:hypothetical protein